MMTLIPGLLFATATADGSCGLPGSPSQGSSSPSMAASQISLYSLQPQTTLYQKTYASLSIT